MILFVSSAIILAVYCFLISNNMGTSLYTWIFSVTHPSLAPVTVSSFSVLAESSNILLVLYLAAMSTQFSQFPIIYGIPLFVPLIIGAICLVARTASALYLFHKPYSALVNWIGGVSTLASIYFLATYFSYSLYTTATINGKGTEITYSLHEILTGPVHVYTVAFVLINCLLFSSLTFAFETNDPFVRKVFSRLSAAWSVAAIICMSLANHYIGEKEFMGQLRATPILISLLYGLYALTAVFAIARLWKTLRAFHSLVFIVAFSSFYYANLPYISRQFIQLGDAGSGSGVFIASIVLFLLIIASGIWYILHNLGIFTKRAA